MEIFKLVGSIFVDSDKADESLQKTDKNASNVGKTLSNGVKKAGQFGAAVVGAAATAVTGMVALATETANTADEIDKQSQKMQMDAESYQELSYAAELCGTNMDTMQTAQKKLLAVGSDLPLVDALKQCAEAEDVAAAATEMFGAKTAQELLPMLNQGADGINAMMNEASNLGLVMSNDAVEAGASFNDTLTTMKDSFTAIVNKLGAKLMPLITGVMNIIIQYMPQIGELFESVTPVILSLMEELLPLFMDLAKELLPIVSQLIQELIPVITEIVMLILPPFLDFFKQVAPILMDIISKILPVLMNLLTAIMPFVEGILTLLSPLLELLNALLTPLLELIDLILTPIIELISTCFKWLADKLGPYIKVFAEWLSEKFAEISPKLKAFSEGMKNFFKNAKEWIKGAWDNLKNFFSNIGDKIKALKDKVKNFAESIANFFKKPINWIIGKLNDFLQGINKIKIPDWVPLVGGKGFNIPLIPELENGGVLKKGQTGFLEGNGAEAVVPLDQNKKWVNAVAEEMNSATGGKTLEAILEKLTEIADMGIYLDGKSLVGGIANEMDRQLGNISYRKART